MFECILSVSINPYLNILKKTEINWGGGKPQSIISLKYIIFFLELAKYIV